MCDVCKKDKRDYRFLNGKKSFLGILSILSSPNWKSFSFAIVLSHDVDYLRLGKEDLLTSINLLFPC